MVQRRRHVHPDLTEDLVEEIIAVLFASDSPVKMEAITRLRAAVEAARQPRQVATPKRLAFFQDFCALDPDAQAVVADVAGWLRRTGASTRREVRASLDALASSR